VVAWALAAVLVAGCSGGPEVPERAAEDAPARTTSTTAAPAPSLERVSASPGSVDAGTDSRFTGVAVGARGVVVIGEVAGDAAIWTTVDGDSYEAVALDRLAFPSGSVLADVVVTPNGFVVVGEAGGGAAGWLSPDGRRWFRTDLADGSVVDVVIVGELGVTAFGRDRGSLATWVSFDGASWRRVPGGPAVFDRAGPARVVGAADDGDGFLAVVDRDGVAEAWSSPDGRVWEVAAAAGSDLLPGAGPPRPEALLGAGSTAVAVGAVADPDGDDAAVWTSLAGAPWERAGTSEAVFGGDGAQAVLAVAQLGADLVAVGTDTDVEGDVDAVLWSTGAGGRWQRSPGSADDGLAGAGAQHAVDVAATRDGALVVGWEEGPEGVRAASWQLVDGPAPAPGTPAGPVLAWRRVPTSEALGGLGEQRLDDVVASGDELVAVGSSHRVDEPAADVDGAVWRSSDGVSWERVPDTTGPLGGPGDQRVLGVVEAPGGGGGALVAVGSDGASAAVWVRPSGGAPWERVDGGAGTLDGAGDQVARAVVAAPDGSLVAVGADGGAGDGDAAVWRSSDGRVWERAGGDLGGPGVQDVQDVAVVGDQLVAVGSSGDSAVAWTSPDGASWTRVDLGPGRAVAVVADGGGAVVVGSVRDGDDLDAAGWRSPDGRTWAPVAVDDGVLGERDQEALDVATASPEDGPPLLVAVGWTGLGPGDDGATWAGADGSAWSRAPHDEDAYGGDQAQRMHALAALGDVVVAVGWSGTAPLDRDAAVWVTAPAGGSGGVL
jgi:hypothetical protein